MRLLFTNELSEVSGGNPLIDSIKHLLEFGISKDDVHHDVQQQPALNAVAYTNHLSCSLDERNHSTLPHECTHTSQQL